VAFSWIYTFLRFAPLILIGSGGYYAYRKYQKK